MTKETSTERIRDRVRHDIATGAFAPGARLTVAALAKRYGSSPMPIRAALQEMQGQGLIVTTPRHGARVRDVDAGFIANVCDLRGAVIALLIPGTVQHITNAGIETLAAIQDRLEDATAAGDPILAMRHNRDFHRTIFGLAGNPVALEVMERTWALLDGLRARYGFGEGRLEAANASHRRLLAALKRRDAASASRILLDSLAKAKQDLIDCVERQESAPAPRRRPR